MKWDRQRLVATAFLFLSVGSGLYLSSISLNYLNYYPGLSQLTAQVDSVAIVTGSNYSRVDTKVTFSNPSSYSGYTVFEADSSTFFDAQGGNATLFTGTGLLQENLIVDRPLGPHSAMTSNILTQLSPSKAGQLFSFEKNNNGLVAANVTLTVQITTFLTAPTGPIHYNSNSNPTLQTS